MPREQFTWVDCTDSHYVEATVYEGDGTWPSMIELLLFDDGTITSDDARSLAAMLNKAADKCDMSTAKHMADSG